MNIFCKCLSESIFKMFDIEADVFVLKEKKIVHIAFERPLISYYFFDELINFIEHYWHEDKHFSAGYHFVDPRLNQSLKWKNDCIFFERRLKNKKKGRNGK